MIACLWGAGVPGAGEIVIWNGAARPPWGSNKAILPIILCCGKIWIRWHRWGLSLQGLLQAGGLVGAIRYYSGVDGHRGAVWTGTHGEASYRKKTEVLTMCEIISIRGCFSTADVSGKLDFYALPLIREAEVAAAPRRSFGSLRGLVAPAFGSGTTAMRQQACVPDPFTSEESSPCLITF